MANKFIVKPLKQKIDKLKELVTPIPTTESNLVVKKAKRAYIPLKTKKKIIIETAKACLTDTKRTDIAKKYGISLTTVNHLASKNREQYTKIVQELTDRVKNRSLFNAEMGLKCIKRKAVKNLDPLKISQMSKNLYEIAVDKSSNNAVQVNINIPQTKEDMLKYIFDEPEVGNNPVLPVDKNIT